MGRAFCENANQSPLLPFSKSPLAIMPRGVGVEVGFEVGVGVGVFVGNGVFVGAGVFVAVGVAVGGD